MSYRYLILGSGMQGTAAAYYLAKYGQAESLILADRNETNLQKAKKHLEKLIPDFPFSTKQVDASSKEALVPLMKEVHGCLSAIDYSLNLEITKAAIEAGCSMVDLGGNTDIVLEQNRLKSQLPDEVNFSIIPDCGLAPGLGNSLAAYGIEMFQQCESVHIRCGGLPQNPKPPLDYKLVFNIRGLTNEYFGKAWLIRNGKREQVDTFCDLEHLEFRDPVGKCEAFVTLGGTSTAPWSFEGQIQNYDYKTLRYPGHYEKMKCLLELGLLDETPVQMGEKSVVPRELFHEVASKKLQLPEDKDLVVMRVDCIGTKDNERRRIRFEMILFADHETGFSAMEMGTGYPAALVLIHAVQGKAQRGIVPLEKALNNRPYFEELTENGLPMLMAESLL